MLPKRSWKYPLRAASAFTQASNQAHQAKGRDSDRLALFYPRRRSGQPNLNFNADTEYGIAKPNLCHVHTRCLPVPDDCQEQPGIYSLLAGKSTGFSPIRANHSSVSIYSLSPSAAGLPLLGPLATVQRLLSFVSSYVLSNHNFPYGTSLGGRSGNDAYPVAVLDAITFTRRSPSMQRMTCGGYQPSPEQRAPAKTSKL